MVILHAEHNKRENLAWCSIQPVISSEFLTCCATNFQKANPKLYFGCFEKILQLVRREPDEIIRDAKFHPSSKAVQSNEQLFHWPKSGDESCCLEINEHLERIFQALPISNRNCANSSLVWVEATWQISRFTVINLVLERCSQEPGL